MYQAIGLRQSYRGVPGTVKPRDWPGVRLTRGRSDRSGTTRARDVVADIATANDRRGGANAGGHRCAGC